MLLRTLAARWAHPPLRTAVPSGYDFFVVRPEAGRVPLVAQSPLFKALRDPRGWLSLSLCPSGSRTPVRSLTPGGGPPLSPTRVLSHSPGLYDQLGAPNTPSGLLKPQQSVLGRR
ncbi:hypothetical protein NDU88_002402 [Pleurodeles waltl]|uniref:Uncharacterized protein n=1 Tax=Pleurodeles waltl TaxID=8319 RepID=A0AAV7WPD6_PLEWA|nr:hypothetical protein NDU88_002402 [Pleurodeles waltl]